MHEFERILKFQPLISSLYNAAQKKLGFEPHVKIVIMKNIKNANNPLGKTAHYSPADHKIGLYTQGRHIKDILRSLAHELVHHNQNCRGDFNNGAATIQGYAQEDGHLREMEREAYECGNMIFRDWEDKLKEKGGKPLFTSTSQYVPPPTSDVVSGALFEGKNMKKNLKESQLRDIIRGVLQEMFNDDLNEGDMVTGSEKDTEESMVGRAAEEEAEKATGPAAVYKGESSSIDEGKTKEHKGKKKMSKKKLKEGVQQTKDHFSKLDATHADYEGKRKKIGGGLVEDSGESEAWHNWKNEHADDDHIREMEHHLRALKDDRDYERKEAEYDHDRYEDEGDKEEEKEAEEEEVEEIVELNEAFFPKGRSIREKARVELNETLMRRWAKIIK